MAASAAIVGVEARVPGDARSARTLGRERNGSGVVIGADGLVLTIGYLIMEADEVSLHTGNGQSYPARVIAYDMATGFGLVRALVNLPIPGVPLGDPAGLAADEPLMVASGGEQGTVSMAQLVARRDYAGYWEYHIEGALFTAPARQDHSGAGLFNQRGELVGVGSLLLGNVLGGGAAGLPGNMFVPVDLLTPILGELQAKGSSSLSRRPWIGVNADDGDGRVRVIRVNPDSPAQAAGLKPGDLILAVNGTTVETLGTFYKKLWEGPAGAGALPPERDVTLTVVQGAHVREVTVHAVDRMSLMRQPSGI